jgi:uncharacterized protein
MSLEAGPFAAWLEQMQGALRGERDMDVPCDGCTACCTSSQFVHIGPDETETLAHIPRELLFPAPRLPPGNVILGYDENGHCPMLVDGACSIYAYRPRTCRTYDCRVFPATGIEVDETQSAIAVQARRWRFDFPTDADRVQHGAVRAAGRAAREREPNPTQRAVLAIRTYG